MDMKKTILLLCLLFTIFCTEPTIAAVSLSYANLLYQGRFVSQSVPDPIVMSPGSKQLVEVLIKNTGKINWNYTGDKYVSVYTIAPSYRASVFADKSWLTPSQPGKIKQVVKPGEVAKINILFKAPNKTGEYLEQFNLAAENTTWIKGASFYIKINVVNPAVISEEISKTSTSSKPVEPVVATMEERRLTQEPIIRVGLYKTDKPVEWWSDYIYTVYAGSENMGQLDPGEKVVLSYKDNTYSLAAPRISFSDIHPIRLVPDDDAYIFTLPKYNRTISWLGKANLNAYRGAMEYRYSLKSQMPYVINELSLEDYMLGIGETSANAPIEYIKAILVAARSYANYQIANGTPIEDKLFDVYASTADQLYLGYNSELAMPRVAAAARETSGEMVTYKNQPVTAPYFANSDGKTRTWKDAWGGANKPWLIPVPCIYDKGKKRLGHGVGMSAADAKSRALIDGWNYKKILQYYYTDTVVEKIY